MRTFLLFKTVLILGLNWLFIKEDTSIYYYEKPIYTSETMLYKDGISEGCYTMQLNIYAKYASGQVILAHTAMIQSGGGCKNMDKEKVLSQAFSKKSGPEYIIKDSQLNGNIDDFISEHQDVYRAFIHDKEKIMGIK